MLRSLNDLQRYRVSATDGDIGSVANFLLDDEHWTLRYLVADIGGVINEREVLISRDFLGQPDGSTHRFHVELTVAKVKATPERTGKPNDAHLRSARDLRGYHIQGSDQQIGHVDDFIIDDETWQVRYLVVDTHNWWFGKKVLVAPHWASRVSWEEKKVFVDLTRQMIKDSPDWGATAAVSRAYEARLHDYYGRPSYWDDSPP